MGSFITYRGNATIPEDKKELFTSQMCRILNLGGMMSTSEVKMFGCTITLLQPVEISAGNNIRFYYNYFEDRPWESAGFDTDKCYLWSGKVGDAEFSDVMSVAYMLYEVYDLEYGFAEKDGDFVMAGETIGWLNHILGTHYGIGKRANIWECIEWDADPDYTSRGILSQLRDLIPYDYRSAAGGTDLADLLYIDNGTSHLSEECVQQGSYPADILKCKRALEKYFAAEQEDKLEKLWKLLKMDYAKRAEEKEENIASIAEFSLVIPARVFVYLTAELQKLNFWKIWKGMSAEVYRDEKMKTYASADLTAWRKEKLNAPVEEVRTSTFLRQDGLFTFDDTPEELRGKPNFYLSDADRLYWWDESDEVEITKETDEWLQKLAQEYQNILQRKENNSDSVVGLKDFMTLLNEINAYYWRIFPFESMFYDFAEHISQREYSAAIELIRTVANDAENRKAGKIIEKRGSGDFCSKNVIENEGRVQVKRLFAVLANKKLRGKYFGF